MLVQKAEERDNTPAAATDTALEALRRAGIQPCMAEALHQSPDHEQGDYESTNELKKYLIAWAILLAHILEMPITDPGKVFLAQVLRAETR